MSNLTDAEIVDCIQGAGFKTWTSAMFRFARAIEAATAAKLNERIAELERLHKQACDMYMMKNRSGCVCKIDPDTDELLSPCGLHDEWLSEKTAELQAQLDAAAVDAERKKDALQSIRAHVGLQPSALARAIVATCDAGLRTGEPKV